jgi:predicted permease
MPSGFRFPHAQQLWLPLKQPSTSGPAEGDPLWIFGRLADGAGEAEAQARIVGLGERLGNAFPDVRAGLRAEVVPFGLTLFPLPRRSFATVPLFFGIQLAALFLLVVACANVAMLMLARSATRLRELAVRTALGASRPRILSQMFAETLVLTLVATGVGLVAFERLFAWLFAQVVVTPALGAGVPYWLDFGVTPRVVVWGLALAATSALMTGVLPAFKISGRGVQQSIQRLSAGASGIRFGRVTTVLIVLDVALTVSVVGFGSLMANRLVELGRRTDLVGIPAEEYLAVTVDLPSDLEESELDRERALVQQVLVERIEAEPRVRAVAVASVLPRMEHPMREVEIEAAPGQSEGLRLEVHTIQTDPGFFDALDRPVLEGRGFERGDADPGSTAVIVNTAFVEQTMGERSPIGRRIRLAPEDEADEPRWVEIVGVVGPLGVSLFSPDGGAAVYVPAAPGDIQTLRLAIHLGASPEDFTPRLREIAADVAPSATIDVPRTPRALSRFMPVDWYLELVLQAALAGLVLILLSVSVSTLYAIMSFAISERAREIGIRRALGAGGERIALAVGRRALGQLALGALLGTPVVVWLFLQLRDYARLDLPTFSLLLTALVPGLAVLLVVALLACGRPTLRALRIDPNEVLKAEG